jgi:hypothetical protein
MLETIEKILNGVGLNNWLTIIAILAAPWVALFIQAKLDDKKEVKSRRLSIYKILMATRATPLSQEHVKALNMIDLEFYGKSKKYQAVKSAWRAYLHVRIRHSVTTEAEMLQFNKDCDETLTTLLVVMGNALGYDFDETHIKESLYKPGGHVTEENYQSFMRAKLVDLFSEKFSLPMAVKIPLEEAQEQKKLRDLAILFFEKKLSEKSVEQ